MRDFQSSRPIMVLLDLLERRWALRVLWELRDERLSFRQLRERCDDVSPTSLNQRLKELREFGLVDLADQGYGYTPLGAELGAQLATLNDWSKRWAEQVQ